MILFGVSLCLTLFQFKMMAIRHVPPPKERLVQEVMPSSVCWCDSRRWKPTSLKNLQVNKVFWKFGSWD